MLLSGFRLELIFYLKGDKIRRDEVDFFNLVDEFGSALGSGFDGDVHASIFQYLNIIIVIGFKLYFNNKCICIYFKKHNYFNGSSHCSLYQDPISSFPPSFKSFPFLSVFVYYFLNTFFHSFFMVFSLSKF